MQKENMFNNLGSVVKSARIEKHMTQRQLAGRLSISTHYLMSIENKQQIPSSELLFRVIRELDIPADIIFYPEFGRDHELIKKLQILLSKCEKNDIVVIIATLQSLLLTKDSIGGEKYAALRE